MICLRETFYDSSVRYLTHDHKVEYALRIGRLFGSFQVPIALAFLALEPRRIPDEAMVEEFRPLYGKGRLFSITSSTREAEANSKQKVMERLNFHPIRRW